ncbi:MAG: hypothetical protein J3K34DRAFT_295303 [Monoraphidium minutum]|nr:MAG: hypothetical protein J3K34DRAFT_295303 [Monoraphidium minutum]
MHVLPPPTMPALRLATLPCWGAACARAHCTADGGCTADRERPCVLPANPGAPRARWPTLPLAFAPHVSLSYAVATGFLVCTGFLICSACAEAERRRARGPWRLLLPRDLPREAAAAPARARARRPRPKGAARFGVIRRARLPLGLGLEGDRGTLKNAIG